MYFFRKSTNIQSLSNQFYGNTHECPRNILKSAEINVYSIGFVVFILANIGTVTKKCEWHLRHLPLCAGLHQRQFPLLYISQQERLEFPFLNSRKTFLGFLVPSQIAGKLFGKSLSRPEQGESFLVIPFTILNSGNKIYYLTYDT